MSEQLPMTTFLDAIGAGARRELLMVLSAASDVRADVVRQFYERPEIGAMAELLSEFEANELVGAELIEALERRAQTPDG